MGGDAADGESESSEGDGEDHVVQFKFTGLLSTQSKTYSRFAYIGA